MDIISNPVVLSAIIAAIISTPVSLAWTSLYEGRKSRKELQLSVIRERLQKAYAPLLYYLERQHALAMALAPPPQTGAPASAPTPAPGYLYTVPQLNQWLQDTHEIFRSNLHLISPYITERYLQLQTVTATSLNPTMITELHNQLRTEFDQMIARYAELTGVNLRPSLNIQPAAPAATGVQVSAPRNFAFSMLSVVLLVYAISIPLVNLILWQLVGNYLGNVALGGIITIVPGALGITVLMFGTVNSISYEPFKLEMRKEFLSRFTVFEIALVYVVSVAFLSVNEAIGTGLLVAFYLSMIRFFTSAYSGEVRKGLF